MREILLYDASPKYFNSVALYTGMGRVGVCRVLSPFYEDCKEKTPGEFFLFLLEISLDNRSS